MRGRTSLMEQQTEEVNSAPAVSIMNSLHTSKNCDSYGPVIVIKGVYSYIVMGTFCGLKTFQSKSF